MIEVEGLVKRHGSLEVLRGVDMTVRPGEVAALIGPSGGGKSTFLRCLNGLEVFQGGCVKVGDLRLDCNPRPGSPAWSGSGWEWCSRASTCSRTRRCSKT